MLISLRIPEHRLRSLQASFTGVKGSLREVTSRGPFPVMLGQKAFPKKRSPEPRLRFPRSVLVGRIPPQQGDGYGNWPKLLLAR